MNQAGPPDSGHAQTVAPTGDGSGAPAGRTPHESGAAPPPSPDIALAPCPACGKGVRVDRRRLRPGRFRLRCAACRQPFGMVVDERLGIRTGRLKDSGSANGDDDLPPEIARTLGMDRPAPPPPRSRSGIRSLSRSGDSTMGGTVARPGDSAAGESAAGLSGSYAAIPTETLSGVVPTTDRGFDRSADMTALPTAAPGAPGGPGSRPGGSVAGYATPPSQVGPSLPPPEVQPGDRLNGYELQKKLGEGGMGAVYLARQLSLDRNVALKLLSPKLSAMPALVGRFLREAYSAGQLVHHNVVQIYDFGKDKPHGKLRTEPAPAELHYFSMEFVDGRSLQDLVKDRGRLDPKEAVSLVLQAARGLAFAHEHGMIHRDIKPDNLMLNRQGVLKVADLGLVKQLGVAEQDEAAAAASAAGDAPTAIPPEPGSISAAATAQITQVSAMMGTPAYMPPEQATDAKTADHRADIYSLGCTLYHLVVGRPPFGGRTLQDVLEAHRTQKVSFPEPIVGGPKLSGWLKDTIRRMCSKKPEERFRSMARVIEELEAYLAEKHQASGEPEEQQTKTLQWAAQQFNASGWFRARPLIIIGFVAVVLAAMGGVWLAAVTGGTSVAGDPTGLDPLAAFGLIGGLLGMAVMTFLFGFVWAGAKRRDVLFVSFRQFVLGGGPVDWLISLLAIGVVVALLYNFGWLAWWVAAGVLALVFAWLWQAFVEKRVQSDQQPMVVRAERIVREMREAGIDEARIRRAVAEAAGRNWEGFYEALFGYEAKLESRRAYGIDEQGREKPRYAPWRDPILSWLNGRLEQRRLKRDRVFLKSLHKNELLAAGVKSDIAERQAGNQALREVGKAALLREQLKAELRREMRREMLREVEPEPEKKPDEARTDEEEPEEAEEKARRLRRKKIKYKDDDFERIHESYFKRRFGTPLDLVLGQQVRFAIAAVLLVCFALWFGQNQEEIFTSGAQEQDVAEFADPNERVGLDRQILRAGDSGERTPPNLWWERIYGSTQPVELPLLGEETAKWLSGFHVGLAGFLLLTSAVFFGRVLSILSLLSAATIVVAPTLLLAYGQDKFWWWALGLGVLLWFVAIFFFRTSED